MLQRGRGKGFRDALTAEPEVAGAAVLRCVTNDPRWDRQVEDRGKYYSDLVLALDLGVGPIEEHLLDADRTGAGFFHTALAIDVLALAARRSRADALDVLRRCVASGSQWSDALGSLTRIAPELAGGLDTMLTGRFSGADELAEALSDLPYEPSSELWSSWLKRNPQLREAHERLERQKTERRSARRAPLPVDFASLRAALSEDAPEDSRATALKALGRNGDPSVVEPAEAAIRTGSDKLRIAGRVALFQLLRAMPIERARQWIGVEGDLGDIATEMLERWGAPEDAPLLRMEIERALTASETTYRECSAVDGVVRLEDTAAVPLLERVFVETTYSYLRVRAARGLMRMSAAFATGFAVECLWDCESATRETGCGAADLAQGRRRMASIAADEIEEESVRRAARARLGSV